MIILEDTRQQAKKHELKHKWFSEHGVMVNRTKLYVGDYTLPTDQSICIDTKKDFAELQADIHVKQMPKMEVLGRLVETEMDYDQAEEAYCLLTGDDADIFVELEIDKFCRFRGLSEETRSLMHTLYVKRHGSFHRELKRAQNNGIKLIILVENRDGVREVRDLVHWSDKAAWKRYNIQMNRFRKGLGRRPAEPQSGAVLMKALLTMESKYGVEFQFCRPEESAERIVKILERS